MLKNIFASIRALRIIASCNRKATRSRSKQLKKLEREMLRFPIYSREYQILQEEKQRIGNKTTQEQTITVYTLPDWIANRN